MSKVLTKEAFRKKVEEAQVKRERDRSVVVAGYYREKGEQNLIRNTRFKRSSNSVHRNVYK